MIRNRQNQLRTNANTSIYASDWVIQRTGISEAFLGEDSLFQLR